MKTGGELAVDALVASGVRTVFGIPGTHTVPLYRALEAQTDRITHITTRHESGAGYAADGYARATGGQARAGPAPTRLGGDPSLGPEIFEFQLKNCEIS